MPQGQLGLADLLHVLSAEGEHAEPLARALGFVAQTAKDTPPEKPDLDDVINGLSAPSSSPETTTDNNQHPRLRWLCQRVVKQRSVEQAPPSQVSSLELEKLSMQFDAALPAFIPYAPWNRLNSVLLGHLRTRHIDSRIDTPKLIKTLAKGRQLHTLPRQPRIGWASQAQLILDLAKPLWPLREDMYWLQTQIIKHRGALGLTVFGFDGAGIGKQGCLLGQQPALPWQAYRIPAAGTPVLILSDLGACDSQDSHQRAADWRRFCERLQANGCNVLVCNPARAALWYQWQRGTGKQTRHYAWAGKAYGTQHSGTRQTALEAGKKQANELLNWLSPAVQVEFQLLRATRQRLKQCPDTELLAWTQPDLRRDSTALALPHNRLDASRARYGKLSKNKPETSQAIKALMETWHQRLAPIHRAEEALYMHRAKGERYDGDTFRRLCALLQTEEGQQRIKELTEYLASVTQRAHRQAWQDDGLAEAYVRTHAHALQAGEQAPPAGLDLARFQTILGAAGGAPQSYIGIERNQQLVFEQWAHASESGRWAPQPSILRLRSTTPYIQISQQTRQGEWAAPQPHPLSQPLIMAHGTQGLKISTGFEEITLSVEPDHHQAQTTQYWGRDQQGVFSTAGADKPRHYVEQTTQPAWASDHGVDQYGPWAEFSITDKATVTQRMRWIAPGAFLMGSPKGEHERHNDERQHPVRLTQGYWLADTACSQALWAAVMENSPSRFEGADLPVEQVSYDDIQKFINKLQTKVIDFDARLPTEAEWEYACRAGTTTVYSTGDTITKKQANYDGDKTLPVRTFAPNDWGLWQMHGNVWEWCQDWYGDYPAGSVTDPSGPAQGLNRVCRGGGWIFNARRLRSAFRLRRVPGSRNFLLGFRLAAGHPVGQWPAEQAPVQDAKPPPLAGRGSPASGRWFWPRKKR